MHAEEQQHWQINLLSTGLRRGLVEHFMTSLPMGGLVIHFYDQFFEKTFCDEYPAGDSSFNYLHSPMSFINIEVKANTNNTEAIRDFLYKHKADFKGVDEQTDTYFNVNSGRLKLRQGNIENNLIYYNRANSSGPKESNFDLVKIDEANELREMLTKAIGVKVVVKKRREIYYIDNVKFHLDSLDGLGNFVEIEASNKNYNITNEKLYEQCNYYVKEFGIKDEDLVNVSYSDMLRDSTFQEGV